MFDKKAINYFAKLVEDTLEHRRKVPTVSSGCNSIVVDVKLEESVI